MFVPGNNPRQSLINFYTWLDLIYDGHGFSCNYKIKSSNERFFIKDAYHHMSGEELNEFFKVLDNITEPWTLECLRSGLSCGAVLRSSHSGKVLISLTPQKIGSMQDCCTDRDCCSVSGPSKCAQLFAQWNHLQVSRYRDQSSVMI